ncbi:MAG: thiol:disulfide interchange protein [Bacteroidetes bacterium]|nr:thiol:disulfide interchange protein [Bacteroidota bacterium]
MKSFLKLTVLLLATVIASPGTAQNREIKFEQGNWASILEKAKKENKTIYLDCYTTWCGPCKWMAKNVFTNDTVADFYNSSFITVEMDMEKGEGKDLAVKYGIRAYPTMLYLSPSGDMLHRTCGSTTVQHFVENGKDALDPAKQLATATKKFNNGNTDAVFASAYFAMLENGCQGHDEELKNYFGNQKESDLTSRNNWNIMYNYLTDYSSPQFTYLEKNKEIFAKLYTADSVQGKINSVYSGGLLQAIRKKDDAGYQVLKTKIKTADNAGSEKIILEADMKLYQRNADWKNYATVAVAYANKYANDNANMLNSLAWTFYEQISDKNMLAEAEKWAKRATEIQNVYAYADTYAAVLYKSGKKDLAKKAAENAIELAKKSGDDYKETQELLQKINQMK